MTFDRDDPRPPPPPPPRKAKPLLFNDVDPTFSAELEASHAAVVAVGEWLRRVYGWSYKAPPPKDDGWPDVDLWVLMPNRADQLTWQAWQVKQRPGMHFTSHETYVDKWGNPYLTAFVGNVHDYEVIGREPPDWVAVVNATATGALIVSGCTKPSWTERRNQWCPTRGRYKDILECPLVLMHYRSLVA